MEALFTQATDAQPRRRQQHTKQQDERDSPGEATAGGGRPGLDGVASGVGLLVTPGTFV